MYRNVPITQEMLSEFCENVHSDLIKFKEDSKLKNELISKINEHIIAIDLKIETNKILINEKNENIIYRLSVINEKMSALEQKMNDLNKIMMKHFAYKKQEEKVKPPPPIVNGTQIQPAPPFTFKPQS